MNETTDNEEWRDVVGYEGLYQVSSHGRVRSLHKERIHFCKLRRTDNGYLRVTLIRSGSRGKQRGVHTLVALAFIGPMPTPNHEVNHIDRDPANNRPRNLEWLTHEENVRHSIDSYPRGIHHYNAKLTPEKVMELYRRLMAGESNAIAREYGVSNSLATKIKFRTVWKHVLCVIPDGPSVKT